MTTISAPKSNSKFDVPADTYLARVVGVVVLGTQPAFEWQGKTIEAKDKIELIYELVETDSGDDKPLWISEEITFTDNDGGTLYARCSTCGVKTSEIDKMVGKPVMVTVKDKDNGKGTKIAGKAGVSGVPGRLEVPQLRNEPIIFNPFDPDMDMWNRLGKFTKKKLFSAVNFNEMPLSKLVTNEETEEESKEY